MASIFSETYLAACEALFGRTAVKRALSMKRNLIIVCVVAASFLSLYTTSQSNQLVFGASIGVDMESAMNQPTTGNTQQPQSQLPSLRRRTVVSLPQRALSNDIPAPDAQLMHSQTPSTQTMEEGLAEPNNNNTVIALIAMGESRNNRLAERIIRSIRAAGLFTGYAMIFTDEEGFQRFQHSLSWDTRTLVVRGREEDMTPRNANGHPIRMRKTMTYQRFKTLIPKYASFYPEVRDAWEYALYLDIDNVVTQDLSGLFRDYHANLLEQVGSSKKIRSNSTDQSFISFWKEKQHFQGGQFIAHRKLGVGCLDAWRAEFDKGKSGKDQPLLMNVHNHFDKYKCRVYTLPHGNHDENQRAKHFDLFTGAVYGKSPKNYPTIVHLTGLRTRLNSESSQRDFLRKALRLENVTDPMMIGNISWEEVMTPVGPKGHRPKQKDDNTKAESNAADAEDTIEETSEKSDNPASPDFEIDDESENGEPIGSEEAENDDEENENDVEDVEEANSLTSLESNVIVRPTDDNTAIALVAMGKAATSSYIAERCIRSIRASGEFNGYIILFTDGDGYEEKRDNLAFDPKVIVIRGKDEHMKPTLADGTRIKYAGPGHMVFKRFKTLVLEYLNTDTRFDDVRYALYLDVDNVVANPLQRLFNDYTISTSVKLAHEDSTDFSYFSFWRDPGMGGKFWQGGQIMYDRHRSQGCVDAWRNEMDTVYHPQDQPLLMNVYNNFTKYGCRVFELPSQGRHFTLLTKKILKGRGNTKHTLVHITGLRTKKFKNFLEEQKDLLRKALHVSDTTEMMTPDISWWDVAQPTDARGRKPKKKQKNDPEIVEATNGTDA